MFIGWLKFSDVSAVVKLAESHEMLVDGYHIKLLMMHAPHLCYGAYENGELVGAALAVSFEKRVKICYLLIDAAYEHQGIGTRLFGTLLGVLESERASITVDVPVKMVSFFERFGFVSEGTVGRYINVGSVPPFHFTNAHAKELDGEHFDRIADTIDAATFGENRQAFLHDAMQRNSSLKFALPHAFMHSSVINARHVYLGPWQVLPGFEEEAEKMIKGVLFFRGLKKIIAHVPLENHQAVKLYERYRFGLKEQFVRMKKGQNSLIKIEQIYAFML